MKPCDLQIHTTASDGKFSSREIVDLALKKEIKVIAITDHDTISGLNDAIEYANGKNIEIVPGVELSCHEDFFTGTIDVLGIFIDHKNSELEDFLKECREERANEKKEIIKKLNALGYAVTFGELLKEGGESLGRPSLARILIRKYPEKFSTISEVFDALIGDGKPAFVLRKNTSMRKAINLIKKAGGISILAHPGRYFGGIEDIIDRFVGDGGNGIEVDYPYDKILKIDKEKSNGINENLREIAKEKGLLVSGGSDFHDFERGNEIGDGGINVEELNLIKQHL